jgi:hypothetical protein
LRFKEWLLTTGLIHFDDGSARPDLDEFFDGIEMMTE